MLPFGLAGGSGDNADASSSRWRLDGFIDTIDSVYERSLRRLGPKVFVAHLTMGYKCLLCTIESCQLSPRRQPRHAVSCIILIPILTTLRTSLLTSLRSTCSLLDLSPIESKRTTRMRILYCSTVYRITYRIRYPGYRITAIRVVFEEHNVTTRATLHLAS